MFGLLIQCLKAFGLQGLLVYVRLKVGSTSGIHLPRMAHPISMRDQHADRISFKEIFIRREYDIDLPASVTPTVIIDGGANVGFTSVFFANKYPQAHIITIEPDDANFRLVETNTRPYPNISAVKAGIWHTMERIRVVDRGFGSRGFMIEPGDGPGAIDAVSIDGLMRRYNLGHIDILKLDIEGSEKEVFSQGYEAWLPKTKCLVIELHDRMKPGCSQAVFRALLQYDFSMDLRGENLVFMNNRYAL